MKKVIILILLFFTSSVFANEITEFQLIKTLKDHSRYVNSVSFSSDGKYLASGSWDNTVKIYSTSDWRLIKTLKDHSGNVNSVLFSSDGQYFASGSDDKTVKIYSTPDWRLITTLKDHSKGVNSVSFSSDGKYLASGSYDKTVKIYSTYNWKLINWRLIKTLKDHSSWVRSISFSSDGKYLASGSYDKTVKIYSTSDWRLIKTLKDHSGYVISVSFTSDGKYLASGSWDNTVKIYLYSTYNWRLIKTLEDHSDIYSVSFSSDGKYLASGSEDKTVKIYSTSDWRLRKTLKDHSRDVESVSFSSDGLYLASGSVDNTVKIYSLQLPKTDEFIKDFVEEHINKWQKKGEFEKTSTYKKRMSRRDEKAKEYFDEAKNIYEAKVKKYWVERKKDFISPIMKGGINLLGNYDADRETFKLDVSTIGDIVLNVPIKYAKSFKQNEDKLELKEAKVVKQKNGFKLSSVEIYNPADNKAFVYNTNVKEEYNPLAEMNFEFKPYNYSFDKVDIESEAVSNIPKKKQKERYYLLKNMPKNSRKNRNAVAVVIGNKNYNKINNVDYAINDARYMKKYLMDTFGYLEQNIIYVPDASQGDFIGIFGKENNYKGRLYRSIRKNESDVFIYYSGHGAPDVNSKKGYFVPVDCDPATVELNGYSIDLLYKNLNKLDYRKLTVVIDACFSGENTLKNVSPVYIKIDNPVVAKKNTAIYSSAKGNQLSTWYPEEKHSLFTYYFLRGINKFGINVTNEKLFDYLEEEVSFMSGKLHSRDQNPTFSGDKSEYLVK
ncbi:MAG: caspase family protein [Candidatus Marinimicrobia bacterium]|nr:caspase family protein [Candidatus Neomarinimicrobiota bacterium]